jgi:excisionase family DNA binding protein
MMDTREVAAYLRLKERRVYDLARRAAIPHVRATGKLLFPRAQIDAWLAASTGTRAAAAAPHAARRVEPAVAPVIAGSHDPLLEWAVRESSCGLAILACGSCAGVERLARGEAAVAALHWRDEATGEDNVPLIRSLLPAGDVVALEWARRAQGLLLGARNPLRIRSLEDLVGKRARVVLRQPEAGSYRLLQHLLRDAGLRPDALQTTSRPVRAETDLAAAIAGGRADAGLGIEAAARAHGLTFIPLAVERMDLVARRRDAFEPPLQALFAFTRTPEFARQAKALSGYDVGATGRVTFNG